MSDRKRTHAVGCRLEWILDWRILATSVALFPAIGCGLFGLFVGECARTLAVQGAVIDASTETPIADVLVGGRTFINGQETDYLSPTTSGGNPNGPPTDTQGGFRLDFSGELGPCTDNLAPFPPPDRIEIVVLRDTCETTYVIEVNGDTVVDLSFPNDTLELRNPILVPPCENADGNAP